MSMKRTTNIPLGTGTEGGLVLPVRTTHAPQCQYVGHPLAVGPQGVKLENVVTPINAKPGEPGKIPSIVRLE